MNYSAERALEDLIREMPPEVRETLSREISNLEYEIAEIECYQDHCDHYDMIESGPIERRVAEKLQKMRLGVYDEERHGDLRETLEELEGLL